MRAVTILSVWVVLVAILSAGVLNWLAWNGPVASGFIAKGACSAVFVSQRSFEEVLNDDVLPTHPLFPFFHTLGFLEIAQEHEDGFGSVTVTLAGSYESKATYRPGYGCALHVSQADSKKTYTSKGKKRQPVEQWPIGDEVDVSSFHSGVQKILEDYIAANNATFQTRQLAVVHKGKLVGEASMSKFPATMPLAGWSMTKSLVNTVIGMLVHEGKLDIKQSKLFPEWTSRGDVRGKITIENLLHMSSGLSWDEVYGKYSPATVMLFMSNSTARAAIARGLEALPGKHFEYSSGSSNILGHIAREKIGSGEDMLDYFYTKLAHKIGAQHTHVEPDAVGDIVFSSFSFAPARDYARFGLLYLQDGVWEGERILPEGWVEQSFAAAPASNNLYASQFWLPQPRQLRDGIPADAALMNGFKGQTVVISRENDLVFVRLGFNGKEFPEAADGALVKKILEALQ